MKRIYNIIRRSLLSKKGFKFFQKLIGVHITPVHYYSPIPNVNELEPDIFTKINECIGIDFNLEFQKSLGEELKEYMKEYQPQANTGLAQVDGYILYSLIREKKPLKFIEIGSGESTKIAIKALEKNREEGIDCTMISIEPYPRDYLKTINFSGFTLLQKKVQDVELSVFKDADFLFIDSSHVSKIGSDVNYEILNIVPIMKHGSIIHWHDIMIPVDYPRVWIENGNMFWNESYLVHAFMLYNNTFQIKWASRYLQVKESDWLRKIFPFYQPENSDEQLSSFWVERTQ